MKFLCEHCKAKYQISDDKVVGKTVRMKCRKCGHMIEVRAEVTETSVSSYVMPEAAEERVTGAGGAAEGAPSPGERDERPGDQPGGTPASKSGSGLLGVPSGPTSKAATMAAPPPAKGGNRPPAVPPRPPRVSTASMPRVTGGGLATSLSAAKPAPPRAAPKSESGGALAGAFHHSVRVEAEYSEGLEASSSSSSEWYVAINGVPVGPVRASELRRKAAAGTVTEDSLVWKEGLEEWRPVRAVTELSAIVREAMLSGRVSLVTPPPPEFRPSLTPGSPNGRTAGPRPPPSTRLMNEASRPSISLSSMGVPSPGNSGAAASGASARSNVVPFGGRAATAERLDTDFVAADEPHAPSRPFDARPSLVAPDPFAAPAPPAALSGMSAAAAAGSAVGHGSSGSSAELAYGGFEPSAAVFPAGSAPTLHVVPASDKRQPPWIPIAMIVLAASFGIVGGISVFFRPQPLPAPVVIVSAAPAALPPPTATVESQEPVASATPDKSAAGARVATSKPTTPSASASAQATKGTVDLGDLLKGSGSGPNGGGAAASGGGGSALTADSIEGVVRTRSAGVKRACWERGGSQASNVNVTVRLVIAASGQVQSATANGNDPVVGKCIENSVRGWTFPPSNGSTNVDIPFHFLRQ